MGTTTAVTVKIHPATPPTTLLEFHNHVDLDSLPDFDDDNKVLANEYNAWVTRIKAMSQAQRLLSTLVGVAPDTSAIAHLTSVIHEATLASSGIPKTKAGFTSDLQQAFQTGLQSLTDGLTISAALSASHYFIQTGGLIDVATSFVTGAVLGISSDGLLKVFPAGKFPPTAFVRATGKANYAAGGRIIADNSTVRFNSSGELEVIAGGRDFKESVRAATTVAGILATDFENGDTIDGVVLVTGNRILIKNQASGVENGIYTVNASGAPTRADDMLAGSSAANNIIPVEEGTANADKAFQCTNNVGSDVVGIDALVFVKLSPADFADGGEAGGAARTLGNTDLQPLGFLTNNINRLAITAGGDVGIGTPTPDAKLHIDGHVGGISLHQEGDFGGRIVTFIENTNSTSKSAALRMSVNSAVALWEIGTDFFQDGSDNLYFFGGGAGDARIFINNLGNVGIGPNIPNGPDELLHTARDVNGSLVGLLVENSQANAGGSTNETVELRFGFGGINDAARISTIKTEDFTSGANESAALSFLVRLNGTTSEIVRFEGDKIGFFGTTPAVQSAAYARNATIVEDRTLLASASATIINNNNVLAAIIADLQAYGLLQ